MLAGGKRRLAFRCLAFGGVSVSGGEVAFVFLTSVFEAGGCLRSGAMVAAVVVDGFDVGGRERE